MSLRAPPVEAHLKHRSASYEEAVPPSLPGAASRVIQSISVHVACRRARWDVRMQGMAARCRRTKARDHGIHHSCFSLCLPWQRMLERSTPDANAL